MRRQIVIAGWLLLLAAGCATSPMEQGLTTLMGQDIKVAVEALGNPKGKSTRQGDESLKNKDEAANDYTVYYWSLGSRREIVRYKDSRSFTGEPSTIRMRCSVRLTADNSGKLVKWDYSGDEHSCAYYGQQLNNYLESKSQ